MQYIIMSQYWSPIQFNETHLLRYSTMFVIERQWVCAHADFPLLRNPVNATATSSEPPQIVVS